jgi:hypothetical protein
VPVLAQLAKDAHLATHAAVDAAISACARIP